MKGWPQIDPLLFRELIFHVISSSLLSQTPLPSTPLRIIPEMKFLPWKILHSSISVGSAKFKAQALTPTNFSLLLWKSSLLFLPFALPLKIKHCSPYSWFAECIICYSSCFHDAETIGSPSLSLCFNFFLNFFNKVVSFHCYCVICGEDSH